MSVIRTSLCRQPLLARRDEVPQISAFERRRRRALREAIADNRRLEFLAALSLGRVTLAANETAFVKRILLAARARRYHLVLAHADRRRCDRLAGEWEGRL